MSTAHIDTPFSPSQDEALRRALAGGARPRQATWLSAVRSFAWRGMLKIKHVPEQLMDVTIMPVLLVLLFTYLFGGAISGSTGEYLQFLLPGILLMVLFSTVYSGVAINTDATKGVVDRFRSLPISQPSPLIGAAVGDVVRYLLAVIVIVGLGVALGYRPEGGVLGVVAAGALVIVFASGLSWVFTVAGLVMRAPNAVTNTGTMVLFPLIFLSNVFVAPETLPSWLASIVDAIPTAHLATATRGLMDGTVPGVEIAISVGTAALLTALFAPLSIALYRRK